MKGKEWMGLNFPFVLIGLIIIALVVVIRSFRLPETGRQITVGCVLVGQKDDKGWNESHYNGLRHACETHNCILKVRESVAEDAAHLSVAVDEMAAEGADVIYLTSSGYGRYTERIAK